MLKVDNLLELGEYLTIIHHTKGRIRLRVNPKIKEKAQDLSVDMVNNLPTYIKGIEKVKVNKLVGSITINYDTNIFEPTLWEELLKGNISDTLRDNLNALLESKEA